MTDETDEQKARRLQTQLTEVLKAWERRSPSASDMATDVMEMVAEALKAERDAGDADARILEEENNRFREQLAEEREARERSEKLNEYFRAAVGECRVMISRNSPEYQIHKEWKSTDLPPRLQRVMKERDAANDLLRRARNLIVCSQGHPEDAASPAWDCAYCGMRAAIAVHLKGGDPTEPVLSQSTGSVTQPGADEGSGLSPQQAEEVTLAEAQEIVCRWMADPNAVGYWGDWWVVSPANTITQTENSTLVVAGVRIQPRELDLDALREVESKLMARSDSPGEDYADWGDRIDTAYCEVAKPNDWHFHLSAEQKCLALAKVIGEEERNG